MLCVLCTIILWWEPWPNNLHTPNQIQSIWNYSESVEIRIGFIFTIDDSYDLPKKDEMNSNWIQCMFSSCTHVAVVLDKSPKTFQHIFTKNMVHIKSVYQIKRFIQLYVWTKSGWFVEIFEKDSFTSISFTACHSFFRNSNIHWANWYVYTSWYKRM